jgi:putative ABC transport system permease protein
VSLAIAFLLFMLLRAIVTAFAGGVPPHGVQRVFVDAKYSMTDNLPIAHLETIRTLPGVATVTPMIWFGGYYQDPKNTFAKIVIDQDALFDVFPDMIVSAETRERFTSSKQAFIAAEALAVQYGWKPGDMVPIRGDIWPKSDGSWDWQFLFAGTYTMPPGNRRLDSTFFVRYDYFNDSVADWVKDKAGWAVARLDPGYEPQTIVAAIDATFENSSDPTKSLSEDEYNRQFANQLGDIGLIMTLILMAVFFTILLLTANVVSAAFRERVPELAVMKTLGFPDFDVSLSVLVEAVVLCVAGAVAGVAAAFALSPMLNANLAVVLGRFEMSWVDVGFAVAIAVVIGLLVGLPPAFEARRLQIVDALRETT